MRLLLRPASFFKRSGDQIIARARTIHERKYMIVRIPFTNHFDTAASLQTCEFFHYERLFRGAHVAIIDVECETG